jgi:hypothetical protein
MARGSKKPVTRSKKQKAAAADTKRLRRFLFLWLPVIIITLTFIYAFSFDPVGSGPKIRIEGTLLEASQPQAGNRGDQTYPVKLANGQVIQVSILEKEGVKKDRRLLVEESETLIFKRKLYRFIRFVD